jgi:hypothetical protein
VVWTFETWTDIVNESLLVTSFVIGEFNSPPGQTPGIKEQSVVDLYEKPELLFFGPDGT